MSYRSRLYNHRNAQSPEGTKKNPFFSKQHESNDAKEKKVFFQAKHEVNSPDDQYEQEADHVANAVVNNKSNKKAKQGKPISSIQRLATSTEDEKLGTNDARMERDKEDKLKPVQKMGEHKKEDEMKGVQEKSEGAEKEKEKPVQKMGEHKKEDEMKGVQKKSEGAEKEKEKPVQKMGEHKKEDEMKGIQKKGEGPEKEKEKPIQKMDEHEKEKDKKGATAAIQKKESGNTPKASQRVNHGIENSAGKGAVLPTKTLKEMNSSFGTDFRNVRIHNDNEAAGMNKDLQAQAFTHGNDIYFNSGKYDPETASGKFLLAHELTHVVQQNGMISRQAAPAPKIRRFNHHGVAVIIRATCDADDFGLDTVETAFKSALDKIFDSDCIEKTRRIAIQSNLRKHGYDVRCADSANLVNAGACAESTGFSIPANIMTLGSEAFGADCGDLGSTILHEIIHVTRGQAGEDVSDSCEASCFGSGGDPDLCKNVDVFGNRHDN